MDFERARERMVERLEPHEAVDDRVADAMRSVPRHEFVPEERRDHAYEDRPLPIGEGQTVSAPHIVAKMCGLLDLEEGDEVLEIGTGCGYHAAVTAEVVGAGNLYSVEYVESLAERARERLADLGYDVHIRVGDGHDGWPEHAPYDAAYLTCAAESPPEAILDQLRTGGRFLGPVGRSFQRLVQIDITEDGRERTEHGGVRFVRMQGSRS